MNDDTPSDDDRYPALSEEGRAMLTFLREHPSAPIFRNQSGHRLLPEDVERVRAFEKRMLSERIEWRPGEPPPWLGEYLAQVFADVPHYRSLGSPPADPSELPSI